MPFETTASTPRVEDFVGQDQAIEAVRFGIAVRRDGYNLFVVGPPGVGKQSVLRQLLGNRAAEELPGEDWCYVHNFDDAQRPHALALPAGRASALRSDMEAAVEELQVTVRSALEGEEYRARRRKLVRALEERQDKVLRAAEQQAKGLEVGIVREQDLFTVTPLRDGKPLLPEEFEELPEEERALRKLSLTRTEDGLDGLLRDFNDWGREQREALGTLERATATAAGARIFAELRSKYADQLAVLEHLSAVEEDLADSVEEFLTEEEPPPGADAEKRRAQAPDAGEGSSFELRASINVLTDHSRSEGAPVVYEDHPTYANLMGRIEHNSQFGSLVADFTLIKAGALHRALGGYLLLDAARLLDNPQAWQALVRTLRSRQICLEASSQQPDAMPIASLQPESIPFADTKVILLGEADLYEILAENDPDFLELFKVLVDFDDRMDRSVESEIRFANLLAWLAFKEGLHDFTRGGIARVLDHAAFLAEDASKLSVRMRPILDLMREADAIASLALAGLVTATHVERAIEAQLRRSGRLRARMLEDVRNGVILIDSSGSRVGQVNGLSVFKSGEHAFGQTLRITARVWVGKGELVDIERDVELGGPLHSKGVLICRGLLGARYATESPLSLSASLVFEQSYAPVDGDSASVAEACALLSALAGLPILQSIAITGSLNQHGDVQAIGGVNEKIEGFFDICVGRGLTGTQGVAIPNANVRHLMLRADVAAAVSAGTFHIWAVESLDDAIQLLIGRDAGQRDAHGHYPEGSINGAVQACLRRFAEVSRRSAHGLPT